MIFVDLETGGIGEKLRANYPGADVVYPWIEILEIGAITVNPENLEVTHSFCEKIKPRFPHRIQREAMEINDYSEHGWRNAESASEVLRKFAAYAAGQTFWGDNPGYDFALLEIYYNFTHQPFPFHHNAQSIFSFVSGVLIAKGYPALSSFSKTADFLGVKEAEPHNAWGGCWKALETYRAALALPPRK